MELACAILYHNCASSIENHVIMTQHPDGEGGILFLMWIPLAWCFLVCKIALEIEGGLEPKVFHGITLGHNEDLIRCWRPCYNFQGHSGAKQVKFGRLW